MSFECAEYKSACRGWRPGAIQSLWGKKALQTRSQFSVFSPNGRVCLRKRLFPTKVLIFYLCNQRDDGTVTLLCV